MKPSSIFRVLWIFLLGASLLLPSRPVFAAGVITVTTTADSLADDGQCSLREAVISANSDTAVGGCTAGSGADTIVFDAALSRPAVFLLTLTGANEDGAASGDLDLSGTVTLDGVSAGEIIVDGNGTDRVFDMRPGATVTLKGLTVRNGDAGAGGNGGGIRVVGTTPASKLSLLNSVVMNNHGVSGGGVQTEGSGATVILQDVRVSGNVADVAGGGLANNGSATLVGSTLDHNQARSGGGIDHAGVSLQITNSTISSNFASDNGGGLYNRADTLLLNVTLANNATADPVTGSNLFNDTAQISLKNSILAGLSGRDNCASNGGFINSQGHNLESANTCGFAAPGDLVNTNPLLLALQDNGGVTPTHALLSGSPALDAADAVDCPATDQRGFSRPTDDNGDGVAVCDIGAFEGSLPPTTLSFSSIGLQDGWIRETAENSNMGGLANSISPVFVLGDDWADQQIRAILSFNTSALPDNAVIVRATLQIKRHSIVGTNPFSTHGNIQIDIRKGFFGTLAVLQPLDFQARAGRKNAGQILNMPGTGNWYSATLSAVALPFVNKMGLTQFRLAFALDDNDDLNADLIRFYSGNALNANYRPKLLIQYYVP